MCIDQLLDKLLLAPSSQSSGAKPEIALHNSHIFARELGFPHRAYPCIHVAGSNGKGSVSLKIATALQAQGYTVGLYTSPHLFHFSERILVNAEPIDEAGISAGLSQLFAIDERLHLQASFFELTTHLAFHYFQQKKVDVAVIETGLGGRLDATNVIDPLLCIITSISLEHTALLGSDLESIAQEKAGILKQKIPCILGPKANQLVIHARAKQLHCAVSQVYCARSSCVNLDLLRLCQIDPPPHPARSGQGFVDQNAPLRFDFVSPSPNSHNLTGRSIEEKGNIFYDVENQAIARAALHVLKSHFTLDEKSIAEGLNARPRCRFEQRGSVIFDVAHNPDAFARLVQALNLFFPEQKKRFVIGMCSDKEVARCFQKVIPLATHLHLVQPKTARAASLTFLEQCLKEKGFYAYSRHLSIADAKEKALLQVKLAGELLVVCGSFYIMKEFLEE